MTKITVNMEEEEEPLPEIYIPKVPNKILMAQYISRDVIWLLMAGFDAGYIYEYPSPEPYVSVEDIEEIDHASLEEMIQQAEHDRIMTVAKQNKHHTLQILSKLSEEYSNIMERNNALPKSHRITRKELELDLRITADLNEELEAEMITVREKLAFKIEKSKLGLQKLLEHFIEPIAHLPFAICKISKPDNIVYSLRQHILNIDITLPHIDTIKDVHAHRTPYIDTGTNGNSVTDRMQHYEEKQREKQKEGEIEEEIGTTQEQSVAVFLKGIDYKDTDSSLGIQLNQMLSKYNLRRTRLEQREKEIQIITEKVDVKIKEITKLRNQIKNMFLEYMSRINDNKFRNFLCRIFKKKYKELKEEDETTTTTTETSSDETNSIDTRESELVYFDENVKNKITTFNPVEGNDAQK
ncbi:wd repeat-containing protein 52 [Lasius niger]|uniref:Wd repeat-containing protein 52 n=1 Tax=Lasius niger TaxID=67767 RepID=A0A0J7L8H2_LASNI|nr:wd repeat-containing protein 52 [Lasius niger]